MPKEEPVIRDSVLYRQVHSLPPIQTLKESESDMCLGNLPSPFDEDNVSSPSDIITPLTIMHSEYDWATFINAYATGQWDPHRTPNPPRSCQPSTNGFSVTPEPVGSAPVIYEHDRAVPHSSRMRPDILPHTESDPHPITTEPSPESNPKSRASAPVRSSTSTISLSPSNSLRRFRPAAPTNLPLPTHRMRSSFSTCSAPSPPDNDHVSSAQSPPHLNSEAQTTAATLRWAAARVDISPLALPSPEHELTDPMRGFTAALPGSHPGPDYEISSEHPPTPGGTRKPRLASFWQGTTDVDRNNLLHNEILSSSHSDMSPEVSGKYPTPPHHDCPVPFPTSFESPERIAAESAPVPKMPELSSGDYFGPVTNGDHPPVTDDVSNDRFHSVVASTYAASTPPLSIPALPRRVCLTRQTSSPLPEASPREPKLGGRLPSESITSIRANRAAKEEQMFSDLGYLAPPNPPDELERRRALYKFNIWNTGSDLNFDRIAHLAKLVFSTKGVVISLIDGNEQWHKSEWGLQSSTTARAHSICAHAILQRGDEPMVILDTHKDWRFANNPSVTGAPHVRFYAGAPLRTADGYNIGALAVICDMPREGFSSRQKHTLKEFAAIAMREMELWRDKIQLRIRDRIQNSMEQFSRECLEIDTLHNELPGGPPELIVGGSMDKMYDRAAKLVKRTLDVEGVIVMDVSHCEVLESMSAEGTISVNMHYGDPNQQTTKRQLSSEEYHQLNAFFAKYPDGKISEGIVPPSFRPFLPTHIQYALSVIILSAVLKRRMILADKAKSLFISNISHELRTPLHGILAAAELLGDSQLNHSQLSFLQTVQACGTSLVETVNHVLDFTKLSGNSKAGGVENVIIPSKVDLMQLVEDAIDGSWIGYRACSAIMGDSVIGSVYSPPKENSDLSNGYVHVVLRELPLADTDPQDKIKVELAVMDTGKGISQNFLKNQLFHPFSQENPLQTGTGLGLAIVNSIVTSESVGGKVEVWSEEGSGTEIKVTFFAEKVDEPVEAPVMEPFKPENSMALPSISLVGFDASHDGCQLLKRVLQSVLEGWWGFEVDSGFGRGGIVILNENVTPVQEATRRRDTSRPFILVTSSRGSTMLMNAVAEHELIGGFCRTLYKPYGPMRLRALLKLCLHAYVMKATPNPPIVQRSHPTKDFTLVPTSSEERERNLSGSSIPRRRSDESHRRSTTYPPRPAMGVRSTSAFPISSTWKDLASGPGRDGGVDSEKTISIGIGGSLLKSSLRLVAASQHHFRVLVVEDNSILRNLLVKWLSQKGYDFCAAVDGRDGVNTFEKQGPFDVVLLDLSMPNLDGQPFVDNSSLNPAHIDLGIAATAEIRAIEAERIKAGEPAHQQWSSARILALTGMSSLEDKRRAFEAGVDG
ncbi:hypothetical protein H0H87_002083 [Tephrocybe sp. NHM501043]|nr:hypothetical protein H0H87_002083 [Tephrocybe sp. NHM501043]